MKIKLLLFLFIIFCYSYSAEYSDTITDRDFTIIKVRDGDTFMINIPNIPDVFGKNIMELKLIDNILSLGKIEYSTPDHQYYETLYKSEDKK